MEYAFFKINSYRLFSGLFLSLFMASSTSASTPAVGERGNPTQNIERTGDATPLQRCWNNTQASVLDLLTLRARGLYADVCCELNCVDQDDNDYCTLLKNFADAIAAFIAGLEMLREVSA
jgi:hypothetical protein